MASKIILVVITHPPELLVHQIWKNSGLCCISPESKQDRRDARLEQVADPPAELYLNAEENPSSGAGMNAANYPEVKSVDRWYPSSKTCSCCGAIKPMPLNIRTYECDSCGLVLDRDLNATINIRNITFGTKGNYACGDTSIGDLAIDESRCVSMKQEKFEVLVRDNGFDQEAYESLARR